MHSCFFRFGSPQRRQALHGGCGGGTVVLRGDVGGVRAKIVVTKDELERIAAGVNRRQCSGVAGRPRNVAAPPAVSLERLQLARAPPRSEPEEGAGAAQRGEWQPALDGIPEEA